MGAAGTDDVDGRVTTVSGGPSSGRRRGRRGGRLREAAGGGVLTGKAVILAANSTRTTRCDYGQGSFDEPGSSTSADKTPTCAHSSAATSTRHRQ